jgi:hypothetical protein
LYEIPIPPLTLFGGVCDQIDLSTQNVEERVTDVIHQVLDLQEVRVMFLYGGKIEIQIFIQYTFYCDRLLICGVSVFVIFMGID